MAKIPDPVDLQRVIPRGQGSVTYIRNVGAEPADRDLSPDEAQRVSVILDAAEALGRVANLLEAGSA